MASIMSALRLPTYTQSEDSRSQQPLPTLPPSPLPTNFLNISRTDGAIKGSYSINSAMQMPLFVVPPVNANGQNLNMRLATQNGAIDVDVDIICHDEKGPTRIEATSMNGSVSLAVRDTSHHPFRVLASSHNGAITLRIPSHFTGPIYTQLDKGRLVITPAVQARLTTFSEDEHDGRFFVGDFAQSGFLDDEAWEGSALRIEAHNGHVMIADIDEKEPKLFFGKMFC